MRHSKGSEGLGIEVCVVNTALGVVTQQGVSLAPLPSTVKSKQNPSTQTRYARLDVLLCHGKGSEGQGVEVCVVNTAGGAVTRKESPWSSVKCVRFECERNRSEVDNEREPGCLLFPSTQKTKQQKKKNKNKKQKSR